MKTQQVAIRLKKKKKSQIKSWEIHCTGAYCTLIACSNKEYHYFPLDRTAVPCRVSPSHLHSGVESGTVKESVFAM